MDYINLDSLCRQATLTRPHPIIRQSYYYSCTVVANKKVTSGVKSATSAVASKRPSRGPEAGGRTYESLRSPSLGGADSLRKNTSPRTIGS